MKNIFSFKIVALIALVAISSCSDFLDTPPSDLLTSDGFYQTTTHAEQGIIGVYAELRTVDNDEFLMMSECRSDNTWVNPATDGIREYSEIGTFRAGNNISTFNAIWNTWYKVIYNANLALSKIPLIDFGTNDALKNQLMGEAYFLRGWAYFELVRLFGNVPVTDEVLLPNEVLDVPQSASREVYSNMILPDLKEAQKLLPYRKEMKSAAGGSVEDQGRADKVAATAMLGRVYMTMAGFPMNDASAQALAEVELKTVIDYAQANNKYWAPDSTEWRKQWMYEYNNKYSIFAVQHRSGSGGSQTTTAASGSGNISIFNFSPALPPSYTTWRIFGNQIYVEKTLKYEFDVVYSNGRRDARGHNHSILNGYAAEGTGDFKNPYTGTVDTLKLADGTVVNVFVNTMFYKYMNSIKKRAALGLDGAAVNSMVKGYYDWPINYPVIRYEDILLMYAEILISKGDLAGAINIVNDIRTRAGCDPVTASSADEAMEYVKNERRIELMGEGVRWFDIVRWGEWKTKILSTFNRYNNPKGIDKANLVDGRYLYPIPLEQMNVKPGLYKQNDGYQ